MFGATNSNIIIDVGSKQLICAQCIFFFFCAQCRLSFLNQNSVLWVEAAWCDHRGKTTMINISTHNFLAVVVMWRDVITAIQCTEHGGCDIAFCGRV